MQESHENAFKIFILNDLIIIIGKLQRTTDIKVSAPFPLRADLLRLRISLMLQNTVFCKFRVLNNEPGNRLMKYKGHISPFLTTEMHFNTVGY